MWNRDLGEKGQDSLHGENVKRARVRRWGQMIHPGLLQKMSYSVYIHVFE